MNKSLITFEMSNHIAVLQTHQSVTATSVFFRMNPNDLKTVNASTSLQQPPVVTVVYHPKNDLNNTKEEACELAPGDKISISALKDVFELRVVKKCREDGSYPVVIPFDEHNVSLNPIQLATDGKFHITGEPQIDVSQHQPQGKFH
jgi:hypothetical protein